MPRRIKRFSSKKRTFRKRRSSKKKITAVKVRNFGFPDVYMTKLKYNETIVFSGAVTPGAQVFRANSLYDPNATGAGHQPTYYDQLSVVYGKYLVLGCSIKMAIQNQSSTGVNFAYTWSDADLSAQTVEDIGETKYGKYYMLGVANGQPVTYRKAYMPMKKIHGQKHLDQDANMYSATNNNPTDQAYFIFKATATDGLTNIGIYVRFSVTYYCKFKEQLDPGES